MKNMTLFFDLQWFERVHLYKDVGMIPVHFKEVYGMESTIVFFENDKNINLCNEELGINLIKLKYDKFKYSFLIYLIKNAKNIDLLMLFHKRKINFIFMILYKILNTKGKVFLKLDISILSVNLLEKYSEKKLSKDRFVLFVIKKLLGKFDLVSVETSECYEKLNKIFNNDSKINLKLIPNGISKYTYDKTIVKTYEEKENSIITVGRIGSVQKNNEMLLYAIKNLDLKDWKIYFIGPIDKNFLEVINKFYKENPLMQESIKFMGSIEDKEVLINFYNNAKVFCLTSKWEGFPLVFPEALFFGNYIISTEVGAEKDITKDGKIGKIIEINNVEKLRKEILDIINGNNKIEDVYNEILEHSKNYMWENIVPEIYRGLYEKKS